MKLSPTQVRLLEAMKDRPSVRLKALAAELGYNYCHLDHAMRQCEREGLVLRLKRDGRNGEIPYALCNPPRPPKPRVESDGTVAPKGKPAFDPKHPYAWPTKPTYGSRWFVNR